jgi:S1-C subfamily serine protease
VEVKEVQIVMPDGLEVPAEVVYKDIDQDLAFIRAKADSKEFASAKFKAIDLKDSVKTDIAEETISLGRADEVLGRQPSVACGQVNVILSKPHLFYRISGAGLGTPTFDADGKLIGIGVVHRLGNKGSVPVVMPAADIVAIAEQAKNAKPIAAEKADKVDKADKSEDKSADKK